MSFNNNDKIGRYTLEVQRGPNGTNRLAKVDNQEPDPEYVESPEGFELTNAEGLIQSADKEVDTRVRKMNNFQSLEDGTTVARVEYDVGAEEYRIHWGPELQSDGAGIVHYGVATASGFAFLGGVILGWWTLVVPAALLFVVATILTIRKARA